MAALWRNVFVVVPADASTVWIVRIPYFDVPVQAVWSAAGATFTWTDSAAATHVIGVSEVFKWRDI
jgi:hypothetical protein